MPIKILKLKSLLEKWIKDKNASDFYSRVTSYSSPHLHTLWWRLPHAQAFKHFDFIRFKTTYISMQLHYMHCLFVLIAGISAKWQSRNALSSPPLTPCVYRATSTTVLETVQDQANVWTWLPRAQVCHNVSGEKDSFSFECYSVCTTRDSRNWRVDLVYWNRIYSLVILDLRYTCISKYNDPETGWNWVKLNITEQGGENHLGAWNFHWKPNNVAAKTYRFLQSRWGQGGKTQRCRSTQTTWGPE